MKEIRKSVAGQISLKTTIKMLRTFEIKLPQGFSSGRQPCLYLGLFKLG